MNWNRRFNGSPQYQRNPRRRTEESVIVISGESVTPSQAAKRLGNLTLRQFHDRKQRAMKRLQPGEALTWQSMLKPGETFGENNDEP